MQNLMPISTFVFKLSKYRCGGEGFQSCPDEARANKHPSFGVSDKILTLQAAYFVF